MTDPDPPTIEEALETLGVSPATSAPAIERAYSEKLEALEKKVAQAATAALRNKYRTAVTRLKLARGVLQALDSGEDLPALEKTVPELIPAPATASLSSPVSLPVPQAQAPRSGKKSSLRALAGAMILIALLTAGGIVFLKGKKGDTSGFAGDYKRRVNYDTVKFDFALQVDEAGTITGSNQRANGSGKPSIITGKVDGKGLVTAKDDGSAQYTGTIEGEEMKLEEKLTGKSFFFSLAKGGTLPSTPPQAEFAGYYHTASVEYPSGNSFEYEFNLTPRGDLAGFFRNLKGDSKVLITGEVSDYGGIKAGTTPDKEGKTTTYSGTVNGDAILLEETLASGPVFNFKVFKGGKPGTTPAPASSFAGRYHSASIEYPGGKKYEFEFNVSATNRVTGFFRKTDQDTKYNITGQIDSAGNLTATEPATKTDYTGGIEGATLVLHEKLPGDGGTFTVKLKKTL